MIFFFVFLNMGPYRNENFKTLLILQIATESFQTFPEFSSQQSSQNYFWDFLNFQFLILNDFFFKFQILKPKTSIIWKTSNRRAKLSENLGLRSSLGCTGIRVTSGTLATCQVSCPNMAILKIGLYLRNHCPQSKNNLNIDSLWQKEGICATSGTLAWWPSFMPKYGSVEYWIHILETAARVEQK